MNEDNILKARLKDLAKKAYQQNIYTYSDFLNPAELGLLDEIRSEISYVDYETFGGTDVSERQMVGFGSEAMFGYEGQWPIAVILVEPLIEKFSDELTHRDVLGALMNLGIERNVMGDIVLKGKSAYVFAKEDMTDYIMDNLTKVKHTNVKCRRLSSDEDMQLLKPELKEMECIVASARFDVIVAALTKNSRSEVIRLFQEKKVTLNGRVCERNSISLKKDDIFSIRGYGKFVFAGEERETRKGRIYVKILAYI
jgi:RNA-binding protein YlmH